jgi:hypothetical protein
MRIGAMIAGVLIAVLSVLCARAGDYGLDLDLSLPKACSDNLNWSFNSCTPKAVVADFKRYFTGAGDFQIEAVHIAFIHNSIHPKSKAETIAFCKGMAELAADPQIKRQKELLKFISDISSWAPKTMSLALHNELNRTDLSADARKNLQRAIESAK